MLRAQQARFQSVPNGGFTLIELILVIVILGILAALALPKFMDMRTEARVAVLTRLRVEVTGAANQAYAKCALIAGCSVPSYGVRIPLSGGPTLSMYNGYPTGKTRTGTPGWHGIKDWVMLQGDFTVFEQADGKVTEFRLADAPTPTACMVRYHEAINFGEPPAVSVDSTGC